MGEDYLTWLYGEPSFFTRPHLGLTGHVSGVPIAHTALFNAPSTLTNPRTPSKDAAMSGKKGVPNIGAAAMATAAFILDVYNGSKYDTTSDDLNLNYGYSNSSRYGVDYQVQNYADRNREMDIEHKLNVSNTLKSVGSGAAAGAAIGSIIPGFGTLAGGAIGGAVGFLGGLWGSGKRHAKANKVINEQHDFADRTNNFRGDMASTTGLLMDFRKKYGDQDGQVLYAKHGKDAWLPGQSAWLNELEPVHNLKTEQSWIVPYGYKNDTYPAILGGADVVYGNKEDKITGVKYEDEARPLVMAKNWIESKRPKTKDKATINTYEKVVAPIMNNLNNLLAYYAQRLHEDMVLDGDKNAMPDNTIRAKHGKDALPRMAKGGAIGNWIPNAIVGGLGVGASIAQYFNAENQSIYKPDTDVKNPYARRALSDLAGIRISPYSTILQLKDTASRANYAVDTSGGLGTGQKMILKNSITANTQSNLAKAIHDNIVQNSQFRANYDNALLSEGAQEAQNRMRQRMWDIDAYMKSHAARLGGMQTAQQNFLAQMQQYIANEYKRRMGNAITNFYSNDLMNMA